MVTVDAVMRRDVVALDPRDPLGKAWRSMTRQRVSGLPVVEPDGRLIGLLTDDDLLVRRRPRRARWWHRILGDRDRLARAYRKAVGTVVGDVMSPPPATVTADTPVDTVVAIMHAQRVDVVPVVARDVLVGVMTPAEAVPELARSTSRHDLPISDAEIRREIERRMDEEVWTHRVHVAVARGVVRLDGLVLSQAERAALLAMARSVPGVTGVEHRLLLRDELTRRLHVC